ncbi:MucBP domain-containing protein [Lactococcus garvieae]|uniref:MucBP domain-containing protein n=1 Tax=Lactococcus garvieae TaxID=1363 RepID=UPI00163C0F4D|nr:MucBP domain-containing protein [Lactococcus garvieae]
MNYIDCQNNVISPSQTLSGGFNETYSTEQKEIEGYTFKEVQGNPKGQFTDKVQTVTYVYTKDKVNPKPGDNKPSHENNTLKPGDNKPSHENNTLKPGDNKSSHENNVHISEISSSTREALPKTGDNERMTLMNIGTGIIILLGVLIISISRFKILKNNK